MPTNVERWCVDTSVAVAALDAHHVAHDTSRAAAQRHRPALSGHAAFEAYSALTRLPGIARVPHDVARAALDRAFPDRCWLTGPQQERLFGLMAGLGIEGGMVYDALVGEAARVAGRGLLTRDVRALRVYDLLEVRYQIVD